jgi:hypothetical protein
MFAKQQISLSNKMVMKLREFLLEPSPSRGLHALVAGGSISISFSAISCRHCHKNYSFNQFPETRSFY